MEQRSAIKFRVRLQKSFTETYSMIQQVFGNEAMSRITTYTWWKRFRNGRESLGNDERSGRPSTAVHDENVSKVRTILLEQPHLTIRIIIENLNIGKDAVRAIYTEKINRRKICSVLFHIC